MRLKGIFKPSDYTGDPAEIAELFDYLAPGNSAPEIDKPHTGIAILAHNPRMARQFASLSRFLVLETGWAQQRADLRELAFLTLNRHFKSDFSLAARRPHALAAGISEAMIAGFPDPGLFDAEQRLVIDYTQAVVTGEVPGELFDRAVARFGEKGVVELTTVIGFWSAWAMIINAADPKP